MYIIDFIYEYFDDYYEEKNIETKRKIYLSFIDEFWKSTQPFKKFKTKNGWSCKRLNKDDECDVFLRTYVNNLYGKYCCEELWINHKKFLEYDYMHFKKVINLYLERIFNNYVPCDVYEDEHRPNEIKSVYDGWGEDSYVVTYIVRSLKGYMMNRMKKYLSGKYIECKCGELVLRRSNRQSMCEKCFEKKRKKDINENSKMYYKKKKDFIQLENIIKPL